MKQYTTPEQTAKMVELGLPRPRCLHDGALAYNIGELIEMLPEALAPLSDPDNEMMLNVSTDSLMWTVRYGEGEFIPYETISCELIDALYAMILQLKEEEVV